MAEVLNTAPEGSSSQAPEGHDAAMIAALESKQNEAATEQVAAPTGELILGKFKSQEDLATAYQELERKQSQGGQEAPNTPPEETTTEQADEAAQNAGLNMEELTAAYNETGDLTEDHYASLEAAGFGRDVVQQYIEGQEAKAEILQTEALKEVGGTERFKALSEWAVQNLSDTQLSQYNNDVESGDLEQVKDALQLLQFRYEASEGKPPKLLTGGNQGGDASGVFNSVAQLTEAMSDPRYAKDPAYRASVEQRLSKSSIF